MKKVIFIVSLLFAAPLFSQAQTPGVMNWMAGTWQLKTNGGLIVEQWVVINDSTLAGKSMFVKNGTDTIPQETIELIQRNGKWSYIPVVGGQNNSQPVVFSVIFQRGTEFIAENPLHDFPQRIAYRRIKTQLFASIEGRKNGKFGKQNFDYSGE